MYFIMQYTNCIEYLSLFVCTVQLWQKNLYFFFILFNAFASFVRFDLIFTHLNKIYNNNKEFCNAAERQYSNEKKIVVHFCARSHLARPYGNETRNAIAIATAAAVSKREKKCFVCKYG